MDTGNFIIRSIWLPGTQTQLALVTADFIKIYDLSKDAAVPQYHFLVPSGKVSFDNRIFLFYFIPLYLQFFFRFEMLHLLPKKMLLTCYVWVVQVTYIGNR